MFILEWFHEIMLDQVNPALCRAFVPPTLWPGWDWALENAIQSHRNRAWYYGSVGLFPPLKALFYDDDDDYDDDEF